MTKISNIFNIGIYSLGLLFLATSTHIFAQSACDFSAPADWIQVNTRWNGQCSASFADGLGILKEFDGSKVKRIFFGRINKGEIDFGVIDQDDGYIAGKFSNGAFVPSDDRQTYIDAFNEAKKAAKKAAEDFTRAGNKASAQFYENKAKELYDQMD